MWKISHIKDLENIEIKYKDFPVTISTAGFWTEIKTIVYSKERLLEIVALALKLDSEIKVVIAINEAH